MKKTKFLLFVLSVVLLAGCATTIRMGHPIRKGIEKYPIGGFPRIQYPIRGGVGSYDIVVNHFERPEGNFYVYSSRFYERKGVRLFSGRFYAILKFVDEDGTSSYTLVDAWWTNKIVELELPEAFKIAINKSIYALEYDFYSWGTFVYSCPLTPEIVVELRNASTIRIWERTLEENERLILQSFLADTANVTYSSPLEVY